MPKLIFKGDDYPVVALGSMSVNEGIEVEEWTGVLLHDFEQVKSLLKLMKITVWLSLKHGGANPGALSLFDYDAGDLVVEEDPVETEKEVPTKRQVRAAAPLPGSEAA